MEISDYILDDFDLVIDNGDFKKGETTRQNEAILLYLNKGESKQYPEAGVGLNNYLLDNRGIAEFVQEASRQLEDDGIEIRQIIMNDWDDITIDGEYQ